MWHAINKRCYNKSYKNYNRYGGRGIKVYEEWKESITKFIQYIENVLGERPTNKHSLDRINNNGDYEPGNLRWSTPEEQSRNRSNSKLNINNVKFIKNNINKYSLQELAAMFNISKTTIYDIKNNKTWKNT